MRIATLSVLRAALTLVGAGGALAAGPGQAVASVITSSVAESSCSAGTNCVDTSFYSTTPASATSSFIAGNFPGGSSPSADTFTTAFNSWNAANGDDWTLINGGTLNLALTLATLQPGASTFTGGIDPVIATLSNYLPAAGDPSLSQLVWVQGLFINYSPKLGTLSAPITTLDTYSLSQGSASSGGAFQTACEPIPGQSPGPNNKTPATIGAVTSGKAYCDPIYPFQYGSTRNGEQVDGTTLSTDFFYDAPQGAWPDNAFRAIALLASVTFVTNASDDITQRDLTVYQGVNYGFNLAVGVPEPATLWLLGSTLPLLAVPRRRGARGGAARGPQPT